jgi:type VI secretion system protein ImpL
MKPPEGLSALAANPWLRAAIALFGVLLLSALVWVFGPLLSFRGIAPLEAEAVRLGIIALLVLAWVAFTVLSFRARKKAEKALIEGVSASREDPSAAAAAEEVAALKRRLAEALTLLTKARGGRALYELPWYVIIGPPGSGKTTALMNAGLTFPLAERMGAAPLAGVGGTRLCDWWFTDEAVLIDTAGRYTTQDSDAAVDKAGWQGFLDLLRRNRPRAPLNGALVAISLADLATHSREERLAHARAVRARLKELDETLGVRLPVYVLFTKADLIAGFTEYFDDLDREGREQVWGVTFPVEQKGPAGFAEAFRALLERVTTRIPERVQAERSPDRRAALFGFPAQLASLEGPAAEFLDAAFRDSTLDTAPALRGLYLTSGTQEGTPIDRLTGAMARLFNVPRPQRAAAQAGQGRSYFLARLLREVVFGESGLVTAKPGAERRRRAIGIAVWSLAALAVLGMGGAWFSAWRSNEAEIVRLEAAVAQLETTARSLPLDPVAEANLPAVLPLLDQARALPYGRDNRAQGSGLGLSQAEKLGAAADAVYRRELDRVLLPRLLWRLESQMRGALQQPEFLYEATRVYLMLGGQGPLDPALVRDWMSLDWTQAFPAPQQAALRGALGRHLDALLEGPMPAYGLDGLLIDEARRVFSRMPLAGRAYSRLRPVAAAANLAPWTPGEAAGPAGARVFARPSGRPLSEGVPGLFTREAFHRVVLPNLEAVSREVAQESWVLGPGNEVRLDDAALVRLQQDVLNLYYDDYARMWDGMLADLAIASFRGMGQAVDTLNILSAPQSPMRDLLASAGRQLTLSVPPDGQPQAQGQPAAGAAPAPQSASARLQAVFGAAQPGAPPPPPPGSAIDDRYARLRQYVGAGPGAPVDNTLRMLSDLYQQLARMAANPGQPITPGAGLDPVQALQGEASRVPPPVDGWIRAVAQGGTAVRAGGAQAALAGAFQAGVAPLCQAAIANRFPFVRTATAETPMDDFARLFSPGGLIDGFFNTSLRPFVDTTQRTWRLQAVEGVTPRVDVANFQRASVIRDVFFAGGPQPTVRFEIQPVAMDPGAQSALLDLDGVTISYSHGPSRPTLVTWPGTNRMNNVRLVFTPAPAGGEGAINASGPWALFRLFARAQVAPGRVPEEFTLTFTLGERQVSYVVRAGSVFNPFSLRELSEFRCPTLQP